jgi:thiol-disulfide isomerase/thioredoxin
MSEGKQIITEFPDRNVFLETLKLNPGIIIIFFHAEWCKPCKTIAPHVEHFFANSPDNVICCDIDVDNSFDLYAFMKNKKMINGIPSLFMYKTGNHSFIPDDSVVGNDKAHLDAFFKRCVNTVYSM